MKLTITTRLTMTTGVLAALILAPAGVALYRSVAASIRAEGVQSTEAAARNMAFMALQRWDDDVLVEFANGTAPLETLRVGGPDWALVRGDGAVVQSHGVFEGRALCAAPGVSRLARVDGTPYRIASVPLVQTASETYERLPAAVQKSLEENHPGKVFLCARREYARFRKDPTKGIEILEISLLEPQRILELKMTYGGRVVGEDDSPLRAELPASVLDSLRPVVDVADVSVVGWLAHDAQLVAVLEAPAAGGKRESIGVNRFAERFTIEAGAVVRDPSSRLWLFTATDATSETAAVARLLWGIALGLPAVWAAVVLVGWFVTRQALSPVKRIVTTVEGIGLSHLDARLPVASVHDELSSISATINGMLERIEDGYRRQRQFTGDASHELRGPLAKVIADIDVALSKARTDEEYREVLARCRRYASGMQRLVESLLWLARFDSRRSVVERRPFELTDLVAEVVRVFPAEDASRVHVDLGEGRRIIEVLGDAELVRVMLHNLVQNALRYSPGDEPVVVRLTLAGATVRIDVEDRGDGIPEEHLAQVFSRFYRVDKSRSRETGGSGLGLSIVHEIAATHGIHVTLANRRLGGLRATFELEAAAPATARDGAPRRGADLAESASSAG